MSTRGLYGYINDGEYTAQYNSSDSYPSYLGLKFYNACKENNFSDYSTTPQILENSISFIKDSIFCEWAYFYDKENRIFEVWKGFQKEADLSNPFGVEYYDASALDRYYPCKRIIRIKIDDLDFIQLSEAYKDGVLDEFCKSFNRDIKIDKIINNDTNS